MRTLGSTTGNILSCKLSSGAGDMYKTRQDLNYYASEMEEKIYLPVCILLCFMFI